jgi:DNA-binding MarR family transcriptional regulator
MPGREQIIETIADTLPEIMRRIIESRPLHQGEFDITLAQMRAMGAIGSQGACTMGELAGRLGISLSAATGLADRMVQQGLIERKPDPQDRRIVRVEVSKSGRRAHASMHKEKQRLMAAALGKLSHGELERMADSLTLLRACLEVNPPEKKEKKS